MPNFLNQNKITIKIYNQWLKKYLNILSDEYINSIIKKLLVLDLDETLIHSETKYYDNYDFYFKN